MAEKKDNAVDFKDTLNLPRTDFPIRPNAKEDDPAMVTRWEDERLYEKAFHLHQGNKRFILHDGPPYANGHIHLGHAYNKILKDIAAKVHRMFGEHVPVIPGWDCHGLPIEFKVTQENPNFSRPDLIRACREYARGWINVQREEFKRLGVVMDWDRPYTTMDFSYEEKELRAFVYFVSKGYIERSNKTVPWCFSCQTVLATAEIEYEDRKDPSIFVLFPLVPSASLSQKINNKPVSLVVWTTTPWTLPLNRAVLAHTQAPYEILDVNGALVVVGKQRADALCALMGIPKVTVAELTGAELAAMTVQHPFIDNLTVPIILDNSVLLEEGTAFVHCAPGAGPLDYEIGVKNDLEIYSPVGPDGKYGSNVEPMALAGMVVTDGQGWVINELTQRGRLLHKTSIKHSYPHCWRCHKGLIFRATKQWFFDLMRDNIKERVLKATNSIDTLPAKSINRLQATLEGRLEWCISRQRVWGVPIPALICMTCDSTYISKEFIERVADGVAKEGIEYWNEVAITELVGKDFACNSCKGTAFAKEQDILDVWFDSGLSHYIILYGNKEQAFPADLYLEGKDQHRGWFQSSVVTSVALEGEPAMKMLVTHGFSVDKDGRKMSKSLGNVVAPQEIIDKLGTDGLRLWASSIDFSSEAVVSDVLLNNVQEVFRKVRNTCRFLLSNLYDFDITRDAVPFEKMRTIDQYALQELAACNYSVLHAYSTYDFTSVFHQLGDYTSVNLSTFYFEIIKDCLYVEKADGHARRSAQTACWYILDTLVRLMAPIFSFTAEQISDLYQKNKRESIHLQQFNLLGDLLAHADVPIKKGDYTSLAEIKNHIFTQDQKRQWQTIKDVRSAILKATEILREQSIIKRSLDARVTLYIDPASPAGKDIDVVKESIGARAEYFEEFLKECALVSQLILVNDSQGLVTSAVPGVYVGAQKAYGVKCPRCWQWSESVHPHALCQRCERAIKR